MAIEIRPGTNIIGRSAVSSRGVATSTGTAFFAGVSARGPVGRAVPIRNLTEFEELFGPWVSYGTLYDSVEVFFREGGGLVYISRVVGPEAVVATATFNASTSDPSIAVDTLGPEDAAGLTVQIVAGEAAGTVRIQVSQDGALVERSYDLDSPAAAVGWSNTSNRIRVRALGANLPATGDPTALTGGDDQRATIADDERVAALEVFESGLGPGQVLFPGGTTSAVHVGLLQHAVDHGRFALLDGPDTTDQASLVAARTALVASTALDDNARSHGMLFAPWLLLPGRVRGTTRRVPPSGAMAGLIARSDGVYTPNVPPAGDNGILRFAVGIAGEPFTDEQRQSLNNAGISLIRPLYGTVRLYGYRTLVGAGHPWQAASHARLRMAIEHGLREIAEAFMFDPIDGQGQKIAEFQGALSGYLQGFWTDGSLYGASPSEAYTVDVGPAVNTPATLADNQLRAVVSLRMAPFAEMVTIEVVKVSITEVI